MTKREFFMRVVLRLAENPQYTYDDDLDEKRIIQNAIRLTDELEDMDGSLIDGCKDPIFEEFELY